ncbi:putative bifunctional diguanylate cyclase/phosphodiesterase [Deinococcus sp.]|uniref:putative bifunctional diguanylate cyclase/phosphodiesterase n=1 Tax=Deinococcus sp. TaxID=47478 RepID=UPI003C7CC3C7
MKLSRPPQSWFQSGLSSPVPLLGLGGLLLVLSALPLSWLLLRWGPPSWQVALSDLCYVPVFVGASLICLFRASRSTGRTRLAWGWISLAPLCFGLGQSVWAYTELWQHRSPFPSVADALYLLQPLLMGTGLLIFPRPVLGRADALRRRLDVGIVIGAMLTVAWTELGEEIVRAWQGRPAAMLVSLAYTVLDIWVLTMLLWNALHASERRSGGPRRGEGGPAGGKARGGRMWGVNVLLTVSVLSAVVADMGFAVTYGLPRPEADTLNALLWTLSACLLGMAALLGRPDQDGRRPQAARLLTETVFRPSPLSRLLGIYGPYLALGSCYLLLFVSLTGHEHLGLLLGAALVTVLVALRQMISQLDNERLTLRLRTLSRDLEGRVQQRTAELEVAGEVLRQLTGELDARVVERTAQLEASQAQLAYQTRHDALTGLPNRSLFEERLNQTLARQSELLTAVVYLNLDGFKAINDRFGHAAGDELLRELARRLQPLRAPEGQLQAIPSGHPGEGLGRCGGDEFVLAFPGLARPEDAESCARRVAAVVGSAFLLGTETVTLSASIGISLAPTDASQAAELIRQADMAMSQAKVGGRNTLYFYSPHMNQAALERSALERRLRLALEQAGRGGWAGESSGLTSGLSLHYQPQYPLQNTVADAAPCAFEALLRWTDAELGPVSPAVFIPVAEDTGLIVPLGRWVLEQACWQLRQWPGSRVAVNVAAAQFERPEFVQEVRAALVRHGLPGACLELELTERQVVGDPEGMARKMRELRELGVQIALDDFGVGQSAMGHLLKLPVGVLKVDRLFIQGLQEVPGAPRVLQAIVALAHALDIRVVAEGVETQAQLSMVRDLGCDLVQGFLTGRPLSAHDAGRLLALPAAPVSL